MTSLPPNRAVDDGIDREAVLRHDHLRAGRYQRVADELDDLVRAVAEDEVGGRHAEFGGELLLQVEGVAVRIEVHLGQRLAHGGQGQPRRAQRVFVGGQLDDVVGGQAEFARDFLDGAAGLIHRHGLEVGVGGVGERHRRVDSR